MLDQSIIVHGGDGLVHISGNGSVHSHMGVISSLSHRDAGSVNKGSDGSVHYCAQG